MKTKAPVEGTACHLSRRELFAMAALTAGGGMAAGGGETPAPASPAANDDAAIERRRRPECLDIPWARGTGLIWMAGETLFYENPRNRFMRFRRGFEIDAAPAKADLRLFADTHYIAWLNGTEVGRGPGRSDLTWTCYDTYDVAPLLRPGRNTLAVLVLFHGFGTGGRQSVMQTLLAHLEMRFNGGRVTHVVSDRSWKASPADEFERPSPRLHATLGCVEVQDMRRAEDGWQAEGFDDSGWRGSDYVKPSLVNTPWYHFVPEPLPNRRLERLPFPRSVRVADADLDRPGTDDLGAVRPAAPDGEAAALPVRTGGGVKPRVVTLDLGRTECGYLDLDVSGPAGATLDALLTEFLVDGQAPQPGSARVHTTRFILREGRQRLRIAFNWLAFRFAQLWIWSPGPVEIRDAAVDRLPPPLGPGGHFRCSDDFLNRLDGICEHTLRLCAQDGIMDSSSREQQQWIGDGRFTAVTLHHRYDAGVIHRRMIEQVGHGIDWMGTMVPRHPTGNINVSPIPLYCLQWVLAFRDYEQFTGDRSLVEDWRPLIRHVLRWFTAFERDDGLLDRVPHWMYIDLGERKPGRIPSSGPVSTTLNLYYRDALLFGAETLAYDAPVAADMRRRADRLAASIRSACWDEASGAYADSVDSRGGFGTISEVANANALALLEDPGSRRAERIIDTIFVRRDRNPIRAGPFMMNMVLAALSRHGRSDLVFPMLAERYPRQVESGSTWEHWDSHGTAGGVPVGHSLSHAWGAGPLAFLVNTVAGLRPDAPGWTSVRVAPVPGPLTEAEAGIETHRGRIAAAWRIEGETFTLRVDLPDGVGGACRLPDGTERAIPPGGGRFACPWPASGARHSRPAHPRVAGAAGRA